MLAKYLFLFWFGGSFYTTLEVFWRGYSHWTMFLLAGIVFTIIGLLNELWSWNSHLISQIAVATGIATLSEFICGCIVNLWLGWHIWDYSNMFGNILGQICPTFILVWIPITTLAIIIDDVIRWKFFNEEKPHYKL